VSRGRDRGYQKIWKHGDVQYREATAGDAAAMWTGRLSRATPGRHTLVADLDGDIAG